MLERGVELARALEGGSIPDGGFHHADHLRVAWVYLDECGGSADAALVRMAATLRRVAAAAGNPGKYSDALTAFWIYQLASVRAALPGADIDAAFRAWPQLLDKRAVPAYNSPDAAAPGSANSSRDA
jgi:hypothetical protein